MTYHKTFLVFFIFLLLSPLTWQLVINRSQVIDYWRQTPHYIQVHFTQFYPGVNQQNIDAMRWSSSTLGESRHLFTLFFNKYSYFFNHLFDYFYGYKPLLYFNRGDGSTLTSSRVEPVAILLLPLSLYGFYFSLNRPKRLLAFFLAAIPSFLTNNYFFPFILPIFLFYLYFAALALVKLSLRLQKAYLLVFLIYSVFLFSRLI